MGSVVKSMAEAGRPAGGAVLRAAGPGLVGMAVAVGAGVLVATTADAALRLASPWGPFVAGVRGVAFLGVVLAVGLARAHAVGRMVWASIAVVANSAVAVLVQPTLDGLAAVDGICVVLMFVSAARVSAALAGLRGAGELPADSRLADLASGMTVLAGVVAAAVALSLGAIVALLELAL